MQFEAQVSKRPSCTTATAREWRSEATMKCGICVGHNKTRLLAEKLVVNVFFGRICLNDLLTTLTQFHRLPCYQAANDGKDPAHPGIDHATIDGDFPTVV